MAQLQVALRILLLCLVPGVTMLAGLSSGAVSLALSSVAVLFEVFIAATAPAKRRGGSNLRNFMLRAGALYMVQIWSLVLRETMSPEPEEPSAPRRVSLDAAAHMRGSALAEPFAPAPSPSPPPPPPPPPPQQPVDYSVTGFDLDAPPESLRWSPKSISVVLPCAEERDLAMKTVMSVFQNTPKDLLHEIVVVDDGSNPPLSVTHLNADFQAKYKVKIMRHDQTKGLISAKNTGGDAATGDIVVFFDCHVAPQKNWHEDFVNLIGENYRRMVIPQITALDIDTWTQIGSGGGMSKCYLTLDGDFKWGGTDDMYMGMLSGGLAGMSKRWWEESGGFDTNMFGWGGENIDQGVRMWVCGGEIVAAPHAQVAHMWRTGSAKTSARYKHVGDTTLNRARAMNAWMGEFAQKLDDFPNFKSRKDRGGPGWLGDMSSFQKVKDRLNGCRPFSWYLRRFKVVYEDAGLIPPDIFMIREESSGKCLRYLGGASTSGAGREGVKLAPCDEKNDRMFWHLGNRNSRTKKCCGGLRAWNTDQCFEGGQGGGKAVTGICELSGENSRQRWALQPDGQLQRGSQCIGPGDKEGDLVEKPCISFRSKGGARFTKQGARVPIETELYRKSQKEHPEIFTLLNAQLKAADESAGIPSECRSGACITLTFADGSGRCLTSDGELTTRPGECAPILRDGIQLKLAENANCLDTWSDDKADTWGFYGCHDGQNQQFKEHDNGELCTAVEIDIKECFATSKWSRDSR